MAEQEEDVVPLRPVHRSLERRIMIKGGEREVVLFVILFGCMVGVVDSVGFGPWFGVPLGMGVTLGGLWVARQMGAADPHMTKVAERTLKYRKSYSARGRPTAKVPTIKGFR